jgi:hypothetical protein
MQIVGIGLIVLGFIFIVLAMVLAAMKVFTKAKEASAQSATGPFDPDAWAGLITAITNFVKVAPEWLVMAAVGAGMVAGGTALL